MRIRLTALAALVVVGTACGGGDSGGSATTVATPPPGTATSLTAPSGSISSSTNLATTSAAPLQATTTTVGTLPVIPVGPDGITYMGGADEQELFGPSMFAVSDDGAIHIVDPEARRILVFRGGEQTAVDLLAQDVLAVTAIAGAGEGLVLVEVFFAPARQRVHVLDAAGTVVRTVDLPPGFQLENGLSGVMVGGDEQIVLEYEGGTRFAMLEPDDTLQPAARVSIGGVVIEPVAPDLTIDGSVITADLTIGLGGLRYLGTLGDGTHVVIRQDVLAVDPAIEVVTSVEWYSAAGGLLGSSRVPDLREQFTTHPPGVALAPDGSVLALVNLSDVVQVVELVMEPGRITS